MQSEGSPVSMGECSSNPANFVKAPLGQENAKQISFEANKYTLQACRQTLFYKQIIQQPPPSPSFSSPQLSLSQQQSHHSKLCS